MAITSLGIDPLTDERFIKNGNTLIDGIQSFSLSGGGYEHMLGAAGITWRLTGNYGMVAAWRYFNGMRSLYDMRPEFTDEQKAQIQSVKAPSMRRWRRKARMTTTKLLRRQSRHMKMRWQGLRIRTLAAISELLGTDGCHPG